MSSFTLLSAPLMALIASPVAMLGYITSSGNLEEGVYAYAAALIIFPGLWIFFIIARRKGWV